MVYLLGIVLAIGLAVWLWGAEAVKKSIKVILLLGIGGVVLMISWAYIAAHQHEQERVRVEKLAAECHKKQEAIYMARTVCARAITTYEEEEQYKCRIDWDLQNDVGIKAKPTWDFSVSWLW